ncbi:hypothetical protein QFC20_007090 [Naganishia adeliensis]|uniref:Uncharacterized protein n=1 Tax=Naganishia adeliensis TaxID=92952 RepID=A0ACC2V462_9TREE|nr:hypothetical protein QFC20_007090 [Naganishia adeliensis]
MASSAANPDSAERPTRLTGKKDGYSFEIWVKVEGEALKVYAETELDEGGSEAWIASDEGKFSVDGTSLGSVVFSEMHSGSQREFDFAGRAMSAGKVQELLFAKPVSILHTMPWLTPEVLIPLALQELTEEATPGIPLQSLATIQVRFFRSEKSTSRPWTQDDNAKEWEQTADGTDQRESEKRRNGWERDKNFRFVNRFGNLHKADNQMLSTSTPHPDDKKDGFFKMQFHYGPKDLLQALGHIPCQQRLWHSRTTRRSSPLSSTTRMNREQLPGGTLQADQAAVNNEISETARQIAALQAQLDALKEEENRKRKAAEEEETKPQILERMGKKLKVAREEDGGFVDLTGDD